MKFDWESFLKNLRAILKKVESNLRRNLNETNFGEIRLRAILKKFINKVLKISVYGFPKGISKCDGKKCLHSKWNFGRGLW